MGSEQPHALHAEVDIFTRWSPCNEFCGASVRSSMKPDVRVDRDCLPSEVRKVSLSLNRLEERKETLNTHLQASVVSVKAQAVESCRRRRQDGFDFSSVTAGGTALSKDRQTDASRLSPAGYDHRTR